MKIDHIGIAVSDLEKALKNYEELFNRKAYKREIVEDQKVETVFFQTGESKVELLGATSDDSVIQKYIEKRGEGIHHIAFEVSDLDNEMNRLKGAGYRFLSDSPSRGADNKRIVFMHPKEHHGVLIELCETVD